MSRPNQYVVGQVIELVDLITDPDTSLPVDDGSDAVTVYQPDGTTVSPSITPGSSGSGEYSAQFTPTQSGWHEYVFTSTGAGAGVGRKRFFVSPIP